MDLKNLREEIDELDSKLVDLVSRRASKVLEIARAKRRGRKSYYSPGREKRILMRLIKKNKGPLPDEALEEVFHLILKTSLALEKKLKVVYLGPPATFTHQAAIKGFSKRADLTPVRSIGQVFTEVEKKKANFGVVPVENSTEGVVNHTLDMFLNSDLKICSEIVLEVSHHLLGRGGMKRITRVCSHPQALAQCQNWLEENLPGVRLIEAESTARAAQRAAREVTSAAIASDIAASLYRLRVLARHIEDRANNYTRFFVIGRNYTEKCGNDKTSILFSIKDKVGALYDMLSPFRRQEINLTKIESRPTKKRPWEYVFFVDFIGHKDDEPVKRALSELEEKCLFLRILGSYPRED